MALKWKLFSVFNYISLIINAIIVVLLVWFAIEKGLSKDDLPTFIPAVAGLFLYLLNSFFNLFVFYRYFPDKELPSAVKVLYIIQTVIFTICLLGLTLLVFLGFREEIANKQYNKSDMILLGILSLLLIMGVYIYIRQVRLIRLIKRNYKQTMTAYIESIGINRENN